MDLKSRVAVYARVSTAHHTQNPEVQLRELKRYCAARDWKIAHELIDHGYSGGHDSRPGLKLLLELARARRVDIVVVTKMDRLFRSLRHLVTTLDEFQALGIQFVATLDNLDYTTPSGRLMVQILGSLAEFEKSLLRERTLLGLDHARAKGKTLGRPRKYDSEAIRALRGQGLSYREIQKQLGCPAVCISRALKTQPANKSGCESTNGDDE